MIAILIVIGILVALSIGFRTWIANISAGIADYAIGSLHSLWPPVRRALYVGGIGWFVLVMLLNQLGAYAHSERSAWIVSILLPFWFAAVIMPTVVNKIYLIGPVVKALKGKISTGILVVSALILMFGVGFPEVKGSLDRRSANYKQAWANSLDKSSLKSEAEVGIIGVVAEETDIYNDQGQSVFRISKGTQVMAIDLNQRSAGNPSEGLTKVMLKNRSGDFIEGNVVNIPSRKINWNG